MSFARRQKREFSRYMNILGEILGRFYEFLEQPNKPTDDEVKSMFQTHQNLWIQCCRKRNLSEKMQGEFNHQVSEAWKHKQSTQQ